MAGRARERLLALLFVAPATLLVAVFVFWPMIDMLHTSLHQQGWSDATSRRFVGVENYQALLADANFRQSVRNTALFTVAVVPFQVLLALGLAVWVNRPGRANRFLRLAVFVPTTVSLAVLSVLWTLLYAPASPTGAGLINGLLGSVGLPPQPFLKSPTQALPAIVLMSIWQGVGLQMVVFLAGLQQIPAQLYEAARLDGATARRLFWHVTLPGVAPTAAFVVMITTIFALKLFVQPYLMTDGGPQGATLSVVQYMYEAAINSRDLGLACAVGVLFFVAVLAITLAQRFALCRAESLQ